MLRDGRLFGDAKLGIPSRLSPPNEGSFIGHLIGQKCRERRLRHTIHRLLLPFPKLLLLDATLVPSHS